MLLDTLACGAADAETDVVGSHKPRPAQRMKSHHRIHSQHPDVMQRARGGGSQLLGTDDRGIQWNNRRLLTFQVNHDSRDLCSMTALHHHLHIVGRCAWITAVDVDAIDKGMLDGVLI